MSKDTFKLILFTIGFTVFVALLFNGGFAGSNVISTNEFPTVSGLDETTNQAQPVYGDISEKLKVVADKAIGSLINTTGLNIAPSQITVVSATEENFPNTALGCEKEGMAYSDVIVDGYKVMLEVSGEIYDYRLDEGERVILCEK
ncbi:MAG: hypothetical protein O2871_03670 [bacterium]|nr:hypothetical protein [bacterium]